MDFEVLILGTDANSYYMARSTYEAYHKKAYLIGTKRLAFTKFSNILNVSYEPNLWDEAVFLKTLDNFIKEHNNKKIILISTNETYTEFISKNKDKINENYLFNYPDIEVINSLSNKEKFYKTYENSNLLFPKTIYFDCQKDNLELSNLTYPIVVKPANVVSYNHLEFVGKNKIYKVNDELELLRILENIKKSGYQDKLILQEFIPGDDSNLFDSVAYVNKNGKVEFITFAQIGLQERTKSMVGNAAVLINGFNTTSGNVKKQVKEIKKFIESINYRGFCEVDMKYDERDNTFKVLEINARQGRCSYYVTSLGHNLVKTIVDDVLYDINKPYEYLDKEVLLSFVPKGIVRKYIKNKEFKKKALKMWSSVVKPMDAPDDKNFLRFLLLRKRWFHYYKEYKNSYWR
jgi:D-aspartate ligase